METPEREKSEKNLSDFSGSVLQEIKNEVKHEVIDNVVVKIEAEVEQENTVKIHGHSQVKSEEVVKIPNQITGVAVNKIVSTTVKVKMQTSFTKDGRRKKYECKQCDKAFHAPSCLERHMPKHSGERKYLCHVCGERFKFYPVLRTHTRKVHADVKSVKDRFQDREIKKKGPTKHECTQCGKIFSSAYELENHLPVHSSEQKFECYICGTKMKRKGTLGTHIRKVHTNVKLYVCPKCGKYFKHVQSLNRHLPLHSGEKKYQCYICKSAFMRREGLNAHLQRQHEPESVQCEFCDKVLASKDNMKKHIIIAHSEVKPYKCEICGERFPIKQYLTVHMHKHLENNEGADAKTYSEAAKKFEKCPMCKYTCHYATDLQFHIKLHENKDMLTCEVCSQLCVDETQMSYHMQKHAKKFHCNICKEAFATKYTLKRHMFSMIQKEINNC